MGSFLSRLNNQLNANTVEETDLHSTNYKYPPKIGNFFSGHYIMGGERFDQTIPESYLFGENADLNFLGSKPTAFPYSPPKTSDPTKTLKSLVNIRKESVKFIKTAENNEGPTKGNNFNIEFIFDADMKCAITIYYFCTEEITMSNVSYAPRDTSLKSETFHYQKGASQMFSQPTHTFNPSLFSDEDLLYNAEKDIYPVAIHCVIEGNEDCRQSHSTICVVDHQSTDGCYTLRAMKQKIYVDGLCYLLQEIYGIENKNISRPITDDDNEDNGSECVICICEQRDTLILPCRHLCLCNSCADSLRYQANNCPICRAPFRALLQIRAVQKSNTAIINMSSQNCTDNGENIPMGYLPISLIEALNGPGYKNTSIDRKDTLEIMNKDNDNKISPGNSLKRNSKEKINQNGTAEQFRMSVLMTTEESSDLLNKRSPSVTRANSNSNREKKSVSRSSSNRDRDCVKYINEKNSNNDLDDDSEAEKLSPLLITDDTANDGSLPQDALHMDGIEDSIDDTDTDAEEKPTNLTEDDTNLTKADDSDYYTPEDPHTTILSPPPAQQNLLNTAKSNEIVTPLAAIKDTELPDSPISGNSQVSTRSSGNDSYSSSSSTRQLLSSVPADANSKQANDVQI
ncbi:unnamed protein product [Diamesa hyperborea]